MSWSAVIVGGASLLGGALSSNAASKGAKAQQDASAQAIAEQKRQFDITQENMAPWLQSGGWALDQQKAFLNGDWSGFQNSPDYKFAVDQGFAGLDRGAAAHGNLWGGGTDADRIALGQGLATQYAGNYYSKLAGMSGTGQTTANQLGSYGQNYANAVGNNLNNAANATASSYQQQSNAWNDALGGVVGAVGYKSGWWGK